MQLVSWIWARADGLLDPIVDDELYRSVRTGLLVFCILMLVSIPLYLIFPPTLALLGLVPLVQALRRPPTARAT